MNAKEVAARKAVEYVRDGMILGLGSGSTATYAIQAIGERVKQEGLNVRGVPTSARSRELGEQLGIPIIELADEHQIDLTIDGADEADPALRLIKGGGGALLREKLVASASQELIIICDDSKMKPTLGAFPLPVAIVPFAWKSTWHRLQSFGGTVTLREARDGSHRPFVTDDGLYILDMHLERIASPEVLEKSLKQIVGVVEVGLFIGLTTRLILGYDDGHTEERLPVSAR